MNKQKILLITIAIALGLTLSGEVLAVKEIPHNAPLQPAPVNSKPNISNNINTQDSETNQVLQAESQAAEESQKTPESENPVPSPDETQAPIIPVTPAIGIYWGLLIIGLLGLIMSAIWGYFRFIRKEK